MATSIRVWSDYVCPWCYIGLAEVERLRAKYDIALEWEPFELRPGAPETGWELPEHIRAQAKSPTNPLALRAKSLGLVLAERTRIPSSRRAHECSEFARAAGALDPFHAAVLTAYWTDGRDLHDWAVLEAAATASGLDAAAMRTEVEAGRWRGAVDDRVAAARDLGISAVPTFVIADRVAISGAQTLDVFEQVMAQLDRFRIDAIRPP